MLDEHARKLITDATQAINAIGRMTTGRTLQDFSNDEMIRFAVERCCTIVGEALVRLRRHDPALAATIPDLSSAIAFRNVVVHLYDGLNEPVVWGIATVRFVEVRAASHAVLDQRS